MKELARLHEEFIAMAERPMTYGALPIQPREPVCPVVPMDRWREANDALFKTYRFREPSHRDQFVISLICYEQETQHNASIRIEPGEVSLKLQTHDTQHVTELDKEYARYADVLYKDLVSRPATVVGSNDEQGGSGDL